MVRSKGATSKIRRPSKTSAGLGLWIPGVAFPLGFAMILLNFWGGVAIMSLSLPVFWWLLRRVFPSGENIIYIGGVIASLLVFAAVLRIIWVSVSIDALLLHDPANYPIGMEIYGIKWEKRL
jgi:hypothetical protein